MAEKVGNDREKIVAFIFRGIAEGVNYLHNVMKMVNRDIKPDNILFATTKHGTNNTHEDRAQIADFTTVVECSSEDYEISGEAGTMAFMPPECFNKGKPYRPKPTDIWAVGVSIYVLMFDRLPFDLSTEKALQEDIKNKEVELPFGSDSLREVLRRTLDKDPATRVTAEQLLEMDWFKRGQE